GGTGGDPNAPTPTIVGFFTGGAFGGPPAGAAPFGGSVTRNVCPHLGQRVLSPGGGTALSSTCYVALQDSHSTFSISTKRLSQGSHHHAKAAFISTGTTRSARIHGARRDALRVDEFLRALGKLERLVGERRCGACVRRGARRDRGRARARRAPRRE